MNWPQLVVTKTRGSLIVSGPEATAATLAVCEADRLRTGGGWLVPQRFLADLEAFAKFRDLRCVVRDKRKAAS